MNEWQLTAPTNIYTTNDMMVDAPHTQTYVMRWYHRCVYEWDKWAANIVTLYAKRFCVKHNTHTHSTKWAKKMGENGDGWIVAQCTRCEIDEKWNSETHTINIKMKMKRRWAQTNVLHILEQTVIIIIMIAITMITAAAQLFLQTKGRERNDETRRRRQMVTIAKSGGAVATVP